MNCGAIIARETSVSVVINAAISIAFFMLVFGLGAPVKVGDMAADFLPQTFMIALMGSLVPPLILRRKFGRAARPIVLRSLLLAVAILTIAGGAAFLICALNPDVTLAAPAALLLRAAYGGVLSLIVTPIALLQLFRASPEANQ